MLEVSHQCCPSLVEWTVHSEERLLCLQPDKQGIQRSARGKHTLTGAYIRPHLRGRIARIESRESVESQMQGALLQPLPGRAHYLSPCPLAVLPDRIFHRAAPALSGPHSHTEVILSH
jgi:hypothetical protein